VTDLLKQVMSRVELLPEHQQDAIAEAIQRELEELEWDALVSTPNSQRFLDELAAEARREHAAGLTVESTDRW
jgi:DnaJ-domain-containing protein 1